MEKSDKIYVAGHHGLVGCAIWNILMQKGYDKVERGIEVKDDVARLYLRDGQPYVFKNGKLPRISGRDADAKLTSLFRIVSAMRGDSARSPNRTGPRHAPGGPAPSHENPKGDF